MEKHTYNTGIMGNCTYLAHINKNTNIDWLCWPRFDDTQQKSHRLLTDGLVIFIGGCNYFTCLKNSTFPDPVTLTSNS